MNMLAKSPKKPCIPPFRRLARRRASSASPRPLAVLVGESAGPVVGAAARVVVVAEAAWRVGGAGRVAAATGWVAVAPG
jgi:hypothetical protein